MDVSLFLDLEVFFRSESDIGFITSRIIRGKGRRDKAMKANLDSEKTNLLTRNVKQFYMVVGSIQNLLFWMSSFLTIGRALHYQTHATPIQSSKGRPKSRKKSLSPFF